MLLRPINLRLCFFSSPESIFLITVSGKDRLTRQKNSLKIFQVEYLFVQLRLQIKTRDSLSDGLLLQIIKSGLMSESDFIKASRAAMDLFEYGQVLEYALIVITFSFYFVSSMITLQ